MSGEAPDDDEIQPGTEGRIVTTAKYSPYITVKCPNDTRVRVPVDSNSARAANQITLAMARQLVEEKIASLDSDDVSIRELKDLADTVTKLNEATQFAYAEEGELVGGSFASSASVDRMAGKLLQTAATGMMDRFSKMASLGARKDPKPVTEIEKAS